MSTWARNQFIKIRLFNYDNSLISDKGVMKLSILLKLDSKFTEVKHFFFLTSGSTF